VKPFNLWLHLDDFADAILVVPCRRMCKAARHDHRQCSIMTTMKTLFAMMAVTVLVLSNLVACKTACDDESPCPDGEFCGNGFCTPGVAPGEGEGEATSEGEGEEGEGEEGEGEGEEGEGEGEGEEGEGEGEGEEGEGEGEGEEGEGERENCELAGDEDQDGDADCADNDCLMLPTCAQCHTELSFELVGDPLQVDATAAAFDGVDFTYFVSGDLMFRERAGVLEQQRCTPSPAGKLTLTRIDAGRSPDLAGGTTSEAIAVGVVTRSDGWGPTTSSVLCQWQNQLSVGAVIAATTDVQAMIANDIGLNSIITAAVASNVSLTMRWDLLSNGQPITDAEVVPRSSGAPFQLLRDRSSLYLHVDGQLRPITYDANGGIFSIRVGEPITITLPVAIYDTAITVDGFPDVTATWLQQNGRAGAVVGEASLGVQPPDVCQVDPQLVIARDSRILQAVRIGATVFAITSTELLRWDGALSAEPARLPVSELGSTSRLFAVGTRILVATTTTAILYNSDFSEAFRSADRVVAVVALSGGTRAVLADGRSAAVDVGVGSWGAFTAGSNVGNRFPTGTVFGGSSSAERLFLYTASSTRLALQRCVEQADGWGLFGNCGSSELVDVTPATCAVSATCLSGRCNSGVCEESSAAAAGMFVTPSGTTILARRGADGADFLTIIPAGSDEASPPLLVPGRDAGLREAFRDGVSFQLSGEGTDLVVGTRFGAFRVVTFAGTPVVAEFPTNDPITIQHVLPLRSDCLDGLSAFGSSGQVCFGDGLVIRSDEDDISGSLLVGPVDGNELQIFEVRGGKTRRWQVQ
jgi:hypothetical protein